MEGTTNQSVFAALGAMVKGSVGMQMGSTQLPAAGDSEDGVKFQELLERQQSADKPQKPDSPAKAEATPKKEQASVEKEEPVQVQEDPREMVRRMMELGAIVTDAPVVQTVAVPVEEEADSPELVEVLAVSTAEETVQMPVAGEAQIQTQMEDEPFVQGETGAEVRPEQPEAAAEDTAIQPQTEQVQMQPEAKTPEKAEKPLDAQVQAKPEQEREEATVTDQSAAEPEAVFHDVETAPIKVGETARTARTEETPDVERQLDSRVTQALTQGETRVELQLTPEHLGTVKVEITRTAEGSIRITLDAQTGETRSLLEKHANGLRELLGERTQDSVHVEVRKEEESQRHNDNPYEGHNGQGRQQQEQRRHSHPRSGEDFLQQLRLGLIPVEDVQG